MLRFGRHGIPPPFRAGDKSIITRPNPCATQEVQKKHTVHTVPYSHFSARFLPSAVLASRIGRTGWVGMMGVNSALRALPG